MLRLSNIRIGTKLAMMTGVAIALVAGLAVLQRLAADAIVAENQLQNDALGVKVNVRMAQIAILRSWVERRNMLLAESTETADTALKNMRNDATMAQEQLDAAVKGTSAPADRDRLNQIKAAFADYITSTETQGNSQKDLLNLRKQQLDTTPAWNKAYGMVAASPDYSDPEVLSWIRDGVSYMKDARIAFWRYSTMLDEEYVGVMHQADSKAIAAFNKAKSAANDDGMKRGLDGLIAVMGDLDTIMDGTQKAVGVKALQEATHTGPARAKLDQLIPPADDAATKAADAASDAQDAEVASSTRMEMIGAGFVILLLIGSAAFGSLSIARPLRRMAGVLRELTDDRIVDVPYADRGDEVGEIAKATEVFKESIAGKVINLRIRTALDVSRSNVMLTDADRNIIYMNGTLEQMLAAAEPEIRKVMPDFDSGKLIGTNVDAIYKDPALASLTGNYEARFPIGREKFMIAASAVVDKNGQRTGIVIEWKNETVEKAIEEEVDGIVKAALEGDFSKRVGLEGKSGFMLNLSNAMNGLCSNVAATMNDFAELLSAMADGDLGRRITAEYRGVFGQLKNDANSMADRIASTIADIKAVGREVSNAAAEIATSTTDLSQRTEEQA
ncbi:MAG TPA: HAMP domain-containing protein, partial [Xanthobacteraceae bacterium]|nr:HAMP domain-containing protein [Xanthobacteraceae bacterium]